MIKPDWKDSPPWANWLAMDDDGEWYWFELEPIFRYGVWIGGGGKIEIIKPRLSGKKTKESRP